MFLPCGFLPLLTSGMDGMVWSLESHATTWSAFLIGNSDFDSQPIDAEYISFTHAAQLSSFEHKGRGSGSLHPELRWSALIECLSRAKRWKWGNIQNPHQRRLFDDSKWRLEMTTLWRFNAVPMLREAFPKSSAYDCCIQMSLGNNCHWTSALESDWLAHVALKLIMLVYLSLNFVLTWSSFRNGQWYLGNTSTSAEVPQELLAANTIRYWDSPQKCPQYFLSNLRFFRWKIWQSILQGIHKTDHSLDLISWMRGFELIQSMIQEVAWCDAKTLTSICIACSHAVAEYTQSTCVQCPKSHFKCGNPPE